MAKKKNTSQLYHFLFHTRKGFYSLFLILVILMVSSIKSFNTEPLEQNVLGKDSESEKRHEEKKEEIKREFRVEPEEVKVKFESKNGSVERKVEIEGNRVKFKEEREEELEDEVENEFETEHDAEIATGSSEVEIHKNKIKARTGFPLTIDLATNQLIVTRPDGTTKIVAILPDQAVANFMRHKKVNLINVPQPPIGSGSAFTGEDSSTSTSTSTLNTEDTHVSLIERNGQLVYEIKGKKRLRVFGILPINASTTGFVSAETGIVVDQEESLLTRLLNLISL